MRNINAAVQAAIDSTNGLKASARLKIYNNRAYFEIANLDISHAIGSPQAAGIYEDTATYQDCRFDSSLNKVVTVFKSTNGYTLGIEGSSTGVEIVNTCAAKTRPTVIPPYVYYQKADGSLVRDLYSYANSTFTITGTQIISSAANMAGSFYGIDASNAIHIYIDDGGVGITHYKLADNVWTANTWSGRIMFPNEVWTSAHLVRLNFASVVKTNQGIFIYLSSPNGEVIGIQILPNGNWSDTFVSFPQDLSKLYISNCIVGPDQRIHLCGQFVRTDNWNSGNIYNLSLWSYDGITFSIDRFTLFSTLGYRFMISLGRGKELFSDMNRMAEVDPSYAYYKEGSTSIEVTESISIFGTTSSGWDVVIGNGSSKYTNHPLITVGNVAKLEIGIEAEGNIVWHQYDNTIISKIDEIFSNGTRSLTLNIVSEGLWRASVATYPFGMEIQSKQTVRDDVEAMDNLSVAENTHGVKDPFCVTLSNVEAPFGVQGKPGGEGPIDYYSGDLISQFYLEEYPEITTFPLNVKLFGWSRIGTYDTNPNVPDDTLASLPNDTFTPVFIVENASGEERTVIIPTEDAVDGINYPPQTWKTGNSRATTGKYPVVFSVGASSGLVVGDKIKQAGIIVSSESPTVYYLERIEIPELPMYMIGTSYGGTLGEDSSWEEVYTPTPYEPPELPPIVFPPITLPPQTFPPITNPPAIPSCGSGPVAAIQLPIYRITMMATTAAGQSYIIPYQCRLRAASSPNPSKISILGDYDEGYAIPYSSAYWWVNTLRNDWYRVEALNADMVVVATAQFSVTGSPVMIGEWEKRTGYFNNAEEVDIYYLRFVVDKCINNLGGFTLTADPYSAPVTPFRPESVGHVNEGAIDNFYFYSSWVKRGTLTWGYTPGGIWIRDVDQESTQAQQYEATSRYAGFLQNYLMTGGISTQYTTSKVLEITYKQNKFANGVYLGTHILNRIYNNPPNLFGETSTQPYWNKYEWIIGNQVAGYSQVIGYEKNDNTTNSLTTAGKGNGVITGSGVAAGYYLSRYLVLYSSAYQLWATHICDSETYITVKFPGFEHPGHNDAPTKLSIIFSSIENVCLS